ncbi:hypothetical protein NPIL_336621 [Nephila pilipes]|uniref:Uncharacterized protein n=1 Tax=Nephila pilipes TaxID=299642 RepID=A0A8X6IWX2_NEPPI|nr:hypothetical protein NPIL_336621 [Nephila pilipes]
MAASQLLNQHPIVKQDIILSYSARFFRPLEPWFSTHPIDGDRFPGKFFRLLLQQKEAGICAKMLISNRGSLKGAAGRAIGKPNLTPIPMARRMASFVPEELAPSYYTKTAETGVHDIESQIEKSSARISKYSDDAKETLPIVDKVSTRYKAETASV